MEIRNTDDGSPTLWSELYGETYHSGFGAVTESMHVFIQAGFNQTVANPLHIFEMGFGTGLNALLTLKFAVHKNIRVKYHSVETIPVPLEIISHMTIEPELNEPFLKMHKAGWNESTAISPEFELLKIKQNLLDWEPKDQYHLIYFDAFSPESQPELWTGDVFQKVYNMLYSRGILTTYCAKGYVRRNMIAAGFKVERLPGPPGKREMLRATKGMLEIQVDGPQTTPHNL
jgi:tRNA U34 5-methylaminomethyl-2-thiouridine-forming methyltransferase MnmC